MTINEKSDAKIHIKIFKRKKLGPILSHTEKSYIVSYHRQHSTAILLKIITNCIGFCIWLLGANETGVILITSHFTIRRKLSVRCIE